ncbi:Ig-like domain-containing protein [Anderseniella sp. Alg231-50]|uniref:Ig-like domain-containing protein n=1 Tax=Anderseniella sp. Alg231-50 TaxID=1922226 RepID=UPI000D555C65
MSDGVGFNVFDLGETPEFIDEIALVPNLDLTAGTQVEVVFPAMGEGSGETVTFTLASDTPAGQPIVVDVQTGENRSVGEHGVNDAWIRLDTAVASIEQAELTPGTGSNASNPVAVQTSAAVSAELLDAAGDAGLQVVFVDASADNVQQLIDGIDPSFEVHIIEADQDGVAFMASVLEGRSGIDAVHIVSHGQSGQLQLGSTMVDAHSIAGGQAQSWAQIGGSLADTGDILVYGCDFGEGRLGSLTIEALSEATGADVAASDDDTGSAALGGDWELEVSTGSVETETISVEEFDGLLELDQSEVVVPATNQADTLAQNIFGAGVTINSASYTGAASQAATFSGALDGLGSEFLGFDSGVIFSTGNANGIVGTADAGNFGTDITDPGATDGDPDFNSLENGISTFDASFLEANITSTTGVLTLQFVFGSDEYNEYVYAGFNDSIGIWINGVNYAVTTDGQQVGIDTINSAGTINPTSNQSDDANDPNSTHDPTDGVYESANQSLHVTRTTEPTQMDGYTTTISVNINLQIGVATDIKIGIADTGDAIYDSWLIVRENSFESVLAAFEDEVVTTPNTSVVISPLDNDFSETYTAADLTITKINGVDVIVGQQVALPSGVLVTLNNDKTLTVDPDGNALSHDTFTYEITDPDGQTAVGLVGMNTNGAPLLNLDPDNSGGGFDNRGFDAFFNTSTGDAVNIADSDVDITDLNSPNLTSMTINVSDVVDGNDEVLNIGGVNFALVTGVTGTLVTADGVNFLVDYDVSGTPDAFSITVQGGGTASQAAWEALIASITYDNASPTATLGNREFDIFVNDGTGNSNVGEAIVHVASPNATIGGTDTGSVTEDSAPFSLTTGGTLTIADPDNGQAQFISSTYGGTYGDVTINPLGGWTYTASNLNPVIDALDAGETLTDVISVTSVDGTSHDITITINGANDAPVANPDLLTVDSNDTEPTTGNVLTDGSPDYDPEGDVLTVIEINGAAADIGNQVTLDSGALVTLNSDGTYSYDPNGSFEQVQLGSSITDSFTYTIDDESGLTDTVTVTIVVNGTNEAPSLDLNAADNAAPVSPSDDFEGGSYPSSGSNWTSDWTESSIGGANGSDINVEADAGDNSLTLKDDGARATRSADLTGAETASLSFDYRRDGFDDSNDFVRVMVSSDGINFVEIGVLSGPANDSAYQTFTADISAYVSPDFAVRFETSGNFNNGGDKVWIDNVDISTTFTPPVDFAASVDNTNAQVAIASPDVDVQDPNDTQIESANIVITNAQVGDLLAVSGSLPGGITASAYNASTGELTLSGTATLADYEQAIEQIQFSTYSNVYTDRAIEVTVNDGGLDSNVATSVITVNNVNDWPVVASNSITVDEETADTSLGLSASDPNGNPLTITVSGLPTLGTVTLADGSPVSDGQTLSQTQLAGLQYDAPADYNGTDDPGDFTYTVSDGIASVTGSVDITLNPINDDPVANADTLTVGEDDTVATSGNVITNDTDIDGDTPLTVTEVNGNAGDVGNQVTLASGALLTLNSDGSYDYDPNGAFEDTALGDTATDTFSYVVSDGNGGSDTATVTVTIDGENDDPVGNADTLTVGEDDTVASSGNVITNDTDIDGDTPLTVTEVNGSAGDVGNQITLSSGALLTLNSDGSYDYDPNGAFEDTAASETATDTFSYVVSDGNGGSDTATVTITINGENDIPTEITESYAESYREALINCGIWSSFDVLAGSVLVDLDNVVDGDVNDSHTFSFVDGTGSPVTDPDLAIVNNELVVRADASLVSGTITSRTVIVRVDDGNGGVVDQTYSFDLRLNTGPYTGSATHDIGLGTVASDTMQGGDGLDRLFGNDGNDFLFGEAGSDMLEGGAGADALDGGSGRDVASYMESAVGVTVDLLNAGANTGDAAGDSFISIEGLWGSSFDDNLHGDNNDNTIIGSYGDDVIVGRGGNDLLQGGEGNDIFTFNNADGDDRIMDFAAGAGLGDVVDVSDYGFADFVTLQSAMSVVDGHVVLQLDANNSVQFWGISNISQLHANDFVL